MAVMTGYNATMTFVTDPVNAISGALCLQDLEISWETDMHEIICLGTLDVFKTPGATRYSYAFSSALDDTFGMDFSNIQAASGTLTFDTVDGLSYSQTAYITGATTTINDGISTVAWTAEGTGAPTYDA